VNSQRRTPHIAHLDLDCFYVSVERIKNPSLRGKPVIVGGSPNGRGVVASASYEARAFGVRSAMPTARALRLCPHLLIARSHFGEYEAISRKLYVRMKELAPVVERASIDEMYLDLTGCESLYHNDLFAFVKRLQQIVWNEFTLPCTISLAANKAVAKIAAGTVKPHGVIYVPPGAEQEFLAPLPIEALPGVGKKTEELLKRHGFITISDLQQATPERLKDLLGKHGRWIFEVALGRGPTHLEEQHLRKSISNERTFSYDISNRSELESKLFGLTESVCSTLRSRQWKARTVTVKLRYSDFSTYTRAHSIPPTDDDAIVFRTARRLFREGDTRALAIRLLGVGLSHFEYEAQPQLSLYPSEVKRGKALQAVDALRRKFGENIIHTGGV